MIVPHRRTVSGWGNWAESKRWSEPDVSAGVSLESLGETQSPLGIGVSPPVVDRPIGWDHWRVDRSSEKL